MEWQMSTEYKSLGPSPKPYGAYFVRNTGLLLMPLAKKHLVKPGCPAALLPGVLGGVGTSRSDRTEQNIGAASEVASHGDEPSRATATDGVVQR